MPMIGIWIGGCVREILEGKVKLYQVDSIFSAIDFSRLRRLHKFLTRCEETEWRANPKQARQILFRLHGESKIVQFVPQSQGYPCTQNKGLWVASEEEIIWKPIE